jgi:hypothetical protein
MPIPAEIGALAGQWQGRNSVYLPGEPERVSETRATIALAAQGRCLTWTYTWSDGGVPQDGLLIVGHDARSRQASGAWIDSWHNGEAIMSLKGEPDGPGLSLRGRYAAPPGPDWGWRITLQADGAEGFRVLMHNITPDGQEHLAVTANYRRVG